MKSTSPAANCNLTIMHIWCRLRNPTNFTQNPFWIPPFLHFKEKINSFPQRSLFSAHHFTFTTCLAPENYHFSTRPLLLPHIWHKPSKRPWKTETHKSAFIFVKKGVDLLLILDKKGSILWLGIDGVKTTLFVSSK